MVATQWLREFYDPRTAPPPERKHVSDKPLSEHAKSVLYAAQKGHLSTRQAQAYLGIARISVERGHKELVDKGMLIGIGQGGARRYLVNVSIGNAGVER